MTIETRLLRRTEVEQYCQIGRSTIYRLMRAGLFPEPIRIGPRAVRWPEQELMAWLARRPRASGEGRQLTELSGARRAGAPPMRSGAPGETMDQSVAPATRCGSSRRSQRD